MVHVYDIDCYKVLFRKIIDPYGVVCSTCKSFELLKIAGINGTTIIILHNVLITHVAWSTLNVYTKNY